MRLLARSALVLIAGLFAVPAAGQSKPLVAPSLGPVTRAAQAELVVTGKVVEIEKDSVEGPAYPGAPKDQRLSYKVAVVKIEDRLIGAKGLTQLRVGFPADAPAVAPAPPADAPPVAARVPRRRGPGAVALTAGQEGCFLLDRLPGADFYIPSGNGPPLDKKDEGYAKQLEAVRKVAKAVEDPVAALKAKDLDDRFVAAHALLRRYEARRARRPDGSLPVRVSDEENRLLVDLLLELPWQPKPDAAPKVAGEPAPSRAALWLLIGATELGFRTPKAVAGEDYNKRMDEATTEFLKNNRERIKIKKYEE